MDWRTKIKLFSQQSNECSLTSFFTSPYQSLGRCMAKKYGKDSSTISHNSSIRTSSAKVRMPCVALDVYNSIQIIRFIHAILPLNRSVRSDTALLQATSCRPANHPLHSVGKQYDRKCMIKHAPTRRVSYYCLLVLAQLLHFDTTTARQDDRQCVSRI